MQSWEWNEMLWELKRKPIKTREQESWETLKQEHEATLKLLHDAGFTTPPANAKDPMSNEPLKEGWSDTKDQPHEPRPFPEPAAIQAQDKTHQFRSIPDLLVNLRMTHELRSQLAAIHTTKQAERLPTIKSESIPGTLELTEVSVPPPTQFFDIPLGDPKDPVRASIPFGLSPEDFEFLLKNLELWKERLTRKL